MNVAKGRKEKRERRLWVRGKVRAEIGEFLGIRILNSSFCRADVRSELM